MNSSLLDKASPYVVGFDTSHYGQMAMRLDYYGGLSELNEDIKNGTGGTPTITWMGTEDETVNEGNSCQT